MHQTNARGLFAKLLPGLLVILTTVVADADPIPQSYSVTDLGNGNPTFSAAPGASPTAYMNYTATDVVIASNGQTA
jgi:hypothetical protein